MLKIIIIIYSLFLFSCNQVTILVGDSTVASNSGWGDAYCKNHIGINRGISGASSKSYWNSYWSDVSPLVEGCTVMIQFGHNDEKNDDRGTTTGDYPEYNGTFREYLISYINDIRSKGAIPILITPVSRMKFGSDGHLLRSHGEYPFVIRSLAKDNDVELIDLEEISYQEFDSLGEKATLELFSNGVDLTHFPPEKSWRVAEMVTSKYLELPLKNGKK